MPFAKTRNSLRRGRGFDCRAIPFLGDLVTLQRLFGRRNGRWKTLRTYIPVLDVLPQSRIPFRVPVTETELISFRNSPIDRLGAFAKKKIRRGTRLIQYIGEKISKAESQKRCEAENYYIFTLDDKWDLDGDKDWNPAKYINHSCEPNAESEVINGEVWIIAIRNIEPGEEITFNYGYDIENYQEHICRCGAPTCIGYMVAEEFFDHFRSLSKAPATSA